VLEFNTTVEPSDCMFVSHPRLSQPLPFPNFLFTSIVNISIFVDTTPSLNTHWVLYVMRRDYSTIMKHIPTFSMISFIIKTYHITSLFPPYFISPHTPGKSRAQEAAAAAISSPLLDFPIEKVIAACRYDLRCVCVRVCAHQCDMCVCTDLCVCACLGVLHTITSLSV
jgi:hypothetical protein